MTKPTPRDILIWLLWESLIAFIQRAYAVLNPGKPLVLDNYLRAIAYHLELVERGEIRRLIIQAPPRHLKSFCVSVAYTAWALGRNPMQRLVCASYGMDLAEGFSKQVREIMRQPWYKEVFPDTCLDPEQATKQEFRTTHNGLRLATSVGSRLTGMGGDKIIVDDALKAGPECTEAARRAAQEWYRSTLATRLDDPKSGAIVVVGQRLHVDDLIGFLMETGEFTVLTLPAEAIKDEVIPIGDDANWMRRKGEILCPGHVDKPELERIRRELGEFNYEAQYQQRPTPPGGGLVKIEWFSRYSGVWDLPRFEAIVQSWDTAMVAGVDNDYSVCTTWGIVGPHYYLLDVYREQLNYPDLKRAVIALKDKFDALLTIVELAGSGYALCDELYEPLDQWIRGHRPEGDKIGRLAFQSAKIEAGRVFLPNEANWLPAFEAEVAAFPYGKHDDQVDSMTQFLRAMDLRLPQLIRITPRLRRRRR